MATFTTMAELNNLDRDCVASKAWNIYYLVLNRKKKVADPWSKPEVLELQCEKELPEGPIKTQIAMSTPRVSDSVSLDKA